MDESVSNDTRSTKFNKLKFMFDYKTKWHDTSNNIWLVMNEEKDGWEFMQVVPSSRKSGYEYWFRRPLYPKYSSPIGRGYSRVVC